ncbi:hypothetical protein NE586_15520, partial [Gemmiger formicilis]|uniref:hypothetical protein n=1 Tax=Gemmiger formicilis TaxID=745368 RepID=UPI00210E880F
ACHTEQKSGQCPTNDFHTRFVLPFTNILREICFTPNGNQRACRPWSVIGFDADFFTLLGWFSPLL